jgi:RimJ/RimL family protein N-acetyltransferase
MEPPADGAPVVETERLTLRRLRLDDAAFILGLLNEPSFIQFIGDRGVRTPDDARKYLEDGPLASYARHGFGLWLVSLKADGRPIGICGLLKRDALEDVDVGYALLPAFWSRGYASEAAAASVEYGRRHLDLRRIVAITQADNAASIRVLDKLGLQFERPIRLAQDSPEVQLYGRTF